MFCVFIISTDSCFVQTDGAKPVNHRDQNHYRR